MDKPKTVKDWLETLPSGYRERALKNMDEEDADIPIESLADAIIEAIDWEWSPEGYDFWSDVYDWSLAVDLPELPEDK